MLGSAAWFVAMGGTFACGLPYALNEWHFHQPPADWAPARVIGGLLIGVGLVPLVHSFVVFTRTGATPFPAASPSQLVVSGFYRHVRNPIYVGFLIVMAGQAALFGSLGLLEYAAVSWLVAAAAVRWYEEPVLARKFGDAYRAYRRAVPAWLPRVHSWTPGEGAERGER
jgi:protein-S-isoprenylcysteine O-methyltransferase Ste14